MKKLLLLLYFSIMTLACGQSDTETTSQPQPIVAAKVISVTTSGTENAYTFGVGISSPDTGCEQYANWWEIVSIEGELLYRRILGHSHVNEQPFTRSGGPVTISKNQEIIVRMHMNTTGYSELAFQGSVENGFESTTLMIDFANDLETVAPLPNGCAF